MSKIGKGPLAGCFAGIQIALDKSTNEEPAATWDMPMLSFFSLGEFGKLDESQCEFHGTMVSWVTLKEKYSC